ncbi:MAG: ribosomal protein S18-alanine N-acetyltransferase [Desulfurococcaceae archaeon]
MEEVPINSIYKEAQLKLETSARGYSVRNASTDDLDKVIEINMVSLPEHYPRVFFEEILGEWGKAFYVVESPNREIVGYIMTRIELKPAFFKYFLAKSGHVVSIAVLEEHRRRGLGYVLMAFSMKSMHEEYNCSETYLEVRVSNTPAIKLYEKLGYRKVKIERGYYLDGEDAFVMARRLP